MKSLKQWIKMLQFVDLTHPLDRSIPTWNGSCGFHAEIKMDYEQGCRVQSYKCHAGVGTHMDAPSHFIRHGKNIGDIPIEELIVPAYVLDLSGRCSADLCITEEDIVQFETVVGTIEKSSLFFAYTGWAQFWNCSEKYRNIDAQGIMHFPTFSESAALFLLNREVVGIGIDTLSPDPHQSSYPVHHLVLGRGKYIIENVAHLDQMPAQGAYVINLPLNVPKGSESPIRLCGLIDKRD